MVSPHSERHCSAAAIALVHFLRTGFFLPVMSGWVAALSILKTISIRYPIPLSAHFTDESLRTFT